MQSIYKVFILFVMLISLVANGQYPGSGNAIDFQNNREIIAPTGANLSPTDTYTDLTVECWVYWRNGSVSGIMEGRPGAVHFEVDNNNDPGRVRVRVHNNNSLQQNNVLNKNEWTHLAFVYDHTPGNEGITLYKNGVQVGYRAGSMGGTNRNFSSVLRFGISCCNTGAGRPFNGFIDEIRVWYDARTQAEIRATMCEKLTGTEPNLTLYYRLDQIVNDTVYDLTPNNNHGVLNNVNAATHLVTSGAAVGDQSVYTYPASWAGQSLYLQGADNDSLRVNNVTANPDGVHIYHVDETPNTTNGINGLGGNDHYYGVFVANDNTATYDATYYYGNNTAFINSDLSIMNETDLALFTRADNSVDPWTNTGSPVNLGNQTITAVAMNTEFILGLNGGEALPIELIDFSVKTPNNLSVELQWITASEINNNYFELQKSRNGIYFETFAQVNGQGNSNHEKSYNYTDRMPYRGTSYYRLKQVDFDGSVSYSDIKSIVIESDDTYSLYPNPIVGGEINLQSSGEQESINIKIHDLSGRLVRHLEQIQINSTTTPLSLDLNKGVYLITLFKNNSPVYKQRIVVK